MKNALKRLIFWQLRLSRAILGNGFIKMNFHRFSQFTSACDVLRLMGASVGERTHIYSDICIYNLAQGDCRHLTIGSNVYTGPRCVFDLTAPITIEDYASVSAQVSFITHLDVGDGPLKGMVPRQEGAITVKRGAWIGVNSTVLHNVTIGESAMVGAMSLVNKDVPGGVLAFGIPCRVQRKLGKAETN
jgi:acetyltransferase-like isoleucine patch superfamily enzyme